MLFYNIFVFILQRIKKYIKNGEDEIPTIINNSQGGHIIIHQSGTVNINQSGGGSSSSAPQQAYSLGTKRSHDQMQEGEGAGDEVEGEGAGDEVEGEGEGEGGEDEKGEGKGEEGELGEENSVESS